MKLRKAVKENIFPLAVAAAYAAIFALRPEMGTESLRNSAYYIREMLAIMPVILILTALIDLWVPKEKIMRALGREAGAKGALLSLVLGSISAGPIYAAFPLCAMLSRKGASVRNLTIILSAWAVIKVPMLLNELKFLGLAFMAVRWALTVAAIFIFSWMTARIVRDEDLPREPARPDGLWVNQDACLGCRLCVKACPELFEMRNRKAALKIPAGEADAGHLARAASGCPVQAIHLPENGAGRPEDAPAGERPAGMDG